MAIAEAGVPTGGIQLRPLIRLARNKFEHGASFKSAASLVKNQLRHIKERGIDTLTFSLGSVPFALNHELVVNALSLTAILGWEYLRAHGLQHILPGADNILTPLTVASVSSSGDQTVRTYHKGRPDEYSIIKPPTGPKVVLRHDGPLPTTKTPQTTPVRRGSHSQHIDYDEKTGTYK